MFNYKSKKNENTEFNSQINDLKNDLLKLKRNRNKNNSDIFYNKEFVDTFKERAPAKNFNMISSYPITKMDDKYLHQKFRSKNNSQIRMINRTTNCEIDESFCLKFETTTNGTNIEAIIKPVYINDNFYDNDDDDDDDEKFDHTENIDIDNIFLQTKPKGISTNMYNNNNNEEGFDINPNKIDKQKLRTYLINGNIIDKYEYVPVENKLKPVIPLVCYTTWHTSNLPPLMEKNYTELCDNNKEIDFRFFNETKCREFIQNNFHDEVLYAYDCLVPSSYKSDLWRYCVLFINGGIYLDIKYNTVNNFKLLELCYSEHFAFDHCGKNLDSIWNENEFGIYTALIVTKPQNIVLRKCIDQIVNNVSTNFYGKNALYPTGPGTLGQKYFETYYDENMKFIENIQLFHHEKSSSIICNNMEIVDIYKSYRDEQKEYQNNVHYSELWKQNAIYNKNYNILHKKIIKNKQPNLPNVLCIIHIGSYHIFMKMKKYIDNLVLAKYDEYNLDIYFNIIDSIRQEHIENIKKEYPEENFIISENYGFDIGSFFHTLQVIKTYNEKYDYVIKVHTKSNNDIRESIMEPLLGSITKIREITQLFQNNKEIGMIASKKSRCIDNHSDFLRNKNYLQQLLNWYFQETTNAIKQPYSTGTIFWIRFDILQNTFFKYNISNIYNSFNNIYTFDCNWYYFANKNDLGDIPYDKVKIYEHYLKNHNKLKLSGNLFHALKYKTKSQPIRDGMIEHTYERFFGYVIHRLKYQLKFIN
jgi:mannosyltransferase OCH1-like enzyme